ncbi:MAG: putative nucleic-acid-binding protein [Paraglaciecola sp.]|jgi:predicted nucleic-acid-binding protein
MIAIDTNVLLRYLLQDDEQQAAKASKLIKFRLFSHLILDYFIPDSKMPQL